MWSWILYFKWRQPSVSCLIYWWYLQYNFRSIPGKGGLCGKGYIRLFLISFSRTLERSLPRFENLRGGWIALIYTLWLGPTTLLDPDASLFYDLPLKNFLSWAKSDSLCAPNLCSSSKFLIPKSLSFLESIRMHPSITIISWSDSVGRYFINDSFPLHLVRYSEKDSLNFCFKFYRSLNDTSIGVFSPYCLMNVAQRSFQSACTNDSNM